MFARKMGQPMQASLLNVYCYVCNVMTYNSTSGDICERCSSGFVEIKRNGETFGKHVNDFGPVPYAQRLPNVPLLSERGTQPFPMTASTYRPSLKKCGNRGKGLAGGNIHNGGTSTMLEPPPMAGGSQQAISLFVDNDGMLTSERNQGPTLDETYTNQVREALAEQHADSLRKSAPESSIRKMKRYFLKKSGGNGPSYGCSICCDPMEIGQEISTLDNCDHKFHTECITPWVRNSNKCPNCTRKALE
jgi:hypothetical protein